LRALIFAECASQIRTEPLDPYFAPYFEGKKRMFEIMVEGKLKQISPDDRIFVGMESGKASMASSVDTNPFMLSGDEESTSILRRRL
jgi:hypothetical protein